MNMTGVERDKALNSNSESRSLSRRVYVEGSQTSEIRVQLHLVVDMFHKAISATLDES